MVARDGDGWIECSCGSKHWGLNGAAGILIYRDGAILLQHRAPWVHNGDTWGIPGGARDSHESVMEGAIREAVEETGIDPQCLIARETHIDDHGIWSYQTIIAEASAELEAHEADAARGPVRAYAVTVTVRWGARDAEAVTLNTLRLGPRTPNA